MANLGKKLFLDEFSVEFFPQKERIIHHRSFLHVWHVPSCGVSIRKGFPKNREAIENWTLKGCTDSVETCKFLEYAIYFFLLNVKPLMQDDYRKK